MRRICTICARGGSKGIKNKNIRQLMGKPLIAHTLEQARNCNLFEVIAVSSDSQIILDLARTYGADVLVNRPPELATDQAGKLPAIRHCVETTEQIIGKQFDLVVDLDATSPLRLPEDIQDAVSLLETENIGNVITGAPARRSPYFNLVELDDDGIVHLAKPLAQSIVRRQDSPPCFDMNASIYVWQHDALFNCPTVFNVDTRLLVMPEERSVDIDSELDFAIVELLMKKRYSV
ncbi:MAG: acylneuraminate cytidylyltransferase family protein [Symploca sp. SIO1B1]|nr:acylneuraminate cytidylyltransferase family protein [Symploca sp. SIO1B1]